MFMVLLKQQAYCNTLLICVLCEKTTGCMASYDKPGMACLWTTAHAEQRQTVWSPSSVGLLRSGSQATSGASPGTGSHWVMFAPFYLASYGEPVTVPSQQDLVPNAMPVGCRLRQADYVSCLCIPVIRQAASGRPSCNPSDETRGESGQTLVTPSQIQLAEHGPSLLTSESLDNPLLSKAHPLELPLSPESSYPDSACAPFWVPAVTCALRLFTSGLVPVSSRSSAVLN